MGNNNNNNNNKNNNNSNNNNIGNPNKRSSLHKYPSRKSNAQTVKRASSSTRYGIFRPQTLL